MIVILILTIFYMLFELFKLTKLNSYWNWNLNRKKYPLLVTVENAYYLYLIALFFVSWIMGLFILIVSGVTAIQVADSVINKLPMTRKIRACLIADGVLTIGVMLYIIIKIV